MKRRTLVQKMFEEGEGNVFHPPLTHTMYVPVTPLTSLPVITTIVAENKTRVKSWFHYMQVRL